MIARRFAAWSSGMLIVAGLGLIVGATVSYARSARQSAPERSAESALAGINHQNSHFLRVRHGFASRPLLGEPMTRIQIPAIGIDSPVIPTAIIAGQWQTADWAVGYLRGSAYPGGCTTFYGRRDCSTDVAAHDDIKGELFERLGDLKVGDTVTAYTRHAVFTYVVSGRQTVDPTNGSALISPAKGLTMVTCTPYWVDTSRLVVTARLTGERPRGHHRPLVRSRY